MLFPIILPENEPVFYCFSLRDIVARKGVARIKNQGVIQRIIDNDVKEKEEVWNAILAMKFEASGSIAS